MAPNFKLSQATLQLENWVRSFFPSIVLHLYDKYETIIRIFLDSLVKKANDLAALH